MEFSTSEGRLQRSLTLHPKGHPTGGFAELAVSLDSGDIISYRWRADEDLDFNIHAHQEEKVDYFLESRAKDADGQFKAPRKDHFYLMWQNPSSDPVEIELEIWV